MRPIRLLLSLCTTVFSLTLLLYLLFGTQTDEEIRSVSSSPSTTSSRHGGRLKALFSFTSPASLFPPSAIISLTDDNSTFFLARPAAFGPVLPTTGLSGPLWIGSSFGDEPTRKDELGCSDVPGWIDGSSNIGLLGLKSAPDARTVYQNDGAAPETKRDADVDMKSTWHHDGSADHRRRPASSSTRPNANIQSMQKDAEIAGKVVLLKRGGCGFLEKVKWAQARGGVALIVGDDVRGGALVRMYAQGDTSDITIPALFTSHTTAHLLSSLLPNGGPGRDLSAEDVAKLRLIKSGKGGKKNKSAGKSAKGSRPTTPYSKNIVGTGLASSHSTGWFRSLLMTLGLGGDTTAASDDNRRPPSSGNFDWVQVHDSKGGQTLVGTKSNTKTIPDPTPGAPAIEQDDWRDTALLSSPTSSGALSQQTFASESKTKGGSNIPSSGEYSRDASEDSKAWFGSISGDKRESSKDSDIFSEGSGTWYATNHHPDHKDNKDHHKFLYVTLTPTNMSPSPFFDTLLVLVVSPLITLTVVYVLLLLRSRIRRRRWRAPKSLVERLPVRTYHTISDVSPCATPTASSPTTPLLLHHPSPSLSSPTHARSQTNTNVPATSSSFLQPRRTPEEEKRESGLAAWRRRYGGRQKECVVCLEEYEDGVSQVMSLPCGHEFHADCITPWLVTRRRTCPICKGDVVRSLSQSYQDCAGSSFGQSRFRDAASSPSPSSADDIQAQAVESRNDSPSASRPVPMPAGSVEADIEANWEDEDEEDGEGRREIPRTDLSSSLRDVSSSVATTIWRGFGAVGRAAGLGTRRSSREEVDRDR